MIPMLEMLRQRIEKEFDMILKDKGLSVIPGFGKADAYGHEAGMPIEDWVKSVLTRINWGDLKVSVYFPNEFLTAIFSKIGKNEQSLWNTLHRTWWEPLLVSKKQVDQFMNGDTVARWQQEG